MRSIREIAERLAQPPSSEYYDEVVSEPKAGSAAVAIILTGQRSEASEGTSLKLCLIKRAERHDDPWSGHMALPGGRVSATDFSIQSAAEREVMEEVGLTIDSKLLIGRLPQLPIRRYRIDTGLMLSPFVYYAGPQPLPLIPNHEVAAAFWVDLDYLWDPANRTTLRATYDEKELVFPAIRIGDDLLWGLTLRVLQLFADRIGEPFAPGPSA
ncbi:MAG TPA: CoA pyrophosphatase [Blastocatellia bacterium]